MDRAAGVQLHGDHRCAGRGVGRGQQRLLARGAGLEPGRQAQAALAERHCPFGLERGAAGQLHATAILARRARRRAGQVADTVIAQPGAVGKAGRARLFFQLPHHQPSAGRRRPVQARFGRGPIQGDAVGAVHAVVAQPVLGLELDGVPPGGQRVVELVGQAPARAADRRGLAAAGHGHTQRVDQRHPHRRHAAAGRRIAIAHRARQARRPGVRPVGSSRQPHQGALLVQRRRWRGAVHLEHHTVDLRVMADLVDGLRVDGVGPRAARGKDRAPGCAIVGSLAGRRGAPAVAIELPLGLAHRRGGIGRFDP